MVPYRTFNMQGTSVLQKIRKFKKKKNIELNQIWFFYVIAVKNLYCLEFYYFRTFI